MKKIKFVTAILLVFSIATMTFSSCSSDENEQPELGELVSSVIPSEYGWSGNSNNGVCTYLPENADAENADVYYAFSFSEGICTEAVFNVVCSSEKEADYIASMLNSGAWVEEEEDEDYYVLRETDNPMTQQMLYQSVSVEKNLSRNCASLSRATSMAIACTRQGKVVFFKLEALKGCSAEDVRYVMKTWDTGLDINNLPEHCIFGEWNAAIGKYVANGVYGFPNTKYEITTEFDGDSLDEFVTTLTMPSQEWAMVIEEAWLEQQYEYEQIFGSAPEVTRDGNKVAMKALILDEVNREQTLQLIVTMDILNHLPFYISIF